jgi:hypothetical protein
VHPEGVGHLPADPPDRVAKVITYSTAGHLIVEVLASLTTSTVLAVTPVPGKFPSVLFDELETAEELVRCDPRWQAAVAARGVTDFTLAMIDTWPSGFLGPADDPATGAARLVRPLTFIRADPGEHARRIRRAIGRRDQREPRRDPGQPEHDAPDDPAPTDPRPRRRRIGHRTSLKRHATGTRRAVARCRPW